MKKPFGYLLATLSVFLVLFTFGIAGLHIANTLQLEPTDPSSVGFKAGSFIGIAIRSVILFAVSFLLFRWGQTLINPAKFSRAARDAADLRRIFAIERLGDRDDLNPSEDDYYASKSDADLISVYDGIDKQKAPDQFKALLAEIAARVKEKPQPLV